MLNIQETSLQDVTKTGRIREIKKKNHKDENALLLVWKG